MSDPDRAAARAELEEVFDALDGKNTETPFLDGLEAVATHVLRDPHRYRTAFGVPYPDAPSTRRAEARWGSKSPLLRGATNILTEPLRATWTDGCLGPVRTEDAREIAARAATGLVGLSSAEGEE